MKICNLDWTWNDDIGKSLPLFILIAGAVSPVHEVLNMESLGMIILTSLIIASIIFAREKRQGGVCMFLVLGMIIGVFRGVTDGLPSVQGDLLIMSGSRKNR